MAANSQSDKVDGNLPLIHPECGKSTPVSSSTVGGKASNKAIKADEKYFLLDIIIARLDIPNITIEQSNKLLVYANFNNKNLKIPPNRINVVDFTTECIMEFPANPVELRQQLLVTPLTLKVSDSKKVLGYGMLRWPTEFLAGLEQGSGEISGSFEIELTKCDGTRTGTMLICVRLQVKCEEYEEDNTLDGKCRNANKEIEPNDVLFVVGEEDKKSCCCAQIGIIPASDSDYDLQPKCLDLSKYRPINSQNVNINILASQDPACQKIEMIQNRYKKILGALNQSKNQSTLKETPFKQKGDMTYITPSDSHLKVEDLPSSSNFCRKQELFPSDGRAFAAKDIKQIPHTASAPKLVENKPQALRHCMICKENMEYLPKLAACPNCGYKPVPQFEETPYDDSQNADQILKEFHDNLQKNDNSDEYSSKSRCTCKYGSKKPCANCRIRKLCEDVFKFPLRTTNNGNDNCEQKSSVSCVSSSDNRPFLTKIFSELKDIYDIEEPIKKEFKLDKRCDKQMNQSSGASKRLPKEKKTNRNMPTIQNVQTNETIRPKARRKLKRFSVKAASEKVVKSKLYDYQIARQAFTYKCEHKACVKNIPKHKNVPPNMGWLWNIHNSGNWKPGVIRKPIKELMRYFLKDFPADTLLVSPYSYRRKSTPLSDTFPHKTILQKPTLHVCKKNGEYIITMRPLKPVDILKDSADPYENMKPIQFRIVKDPQLKIARSLKSCLKSMGFKKCVCHRPIALCSCRSFVEKMRLEYQCRKECSARQIESCCDTLVLTDTSESEDEFDFAVTPPVALVKPDKLNRPNLVNVATQYNELDWNPVPLFPRPPNKYLQMYQCAVTERKGKTVLAGNDNSGTKGSCSKIPFGNSTGAAGKRQIVERGFASNRGGGDGILMGRIPSKGSSAPAEFRGKYGGRGDPTKGASVPDRYGGRGDLAFQKVSKAAEKAPNKKVDMLKYLQKAKKKMVKLKPAEIALKRKEKLKLLKGVNPPLLCTIDRLGKPTDPCAPFIPCADDRVC